jgi:hypothetical protein
MPRLHINLHDIDEIEDLEDQENWDALLGIGAARRDARNTLDTRERGERRFGGSEVVARKRADRRKTGLRVAKRI